MSDAMIESKYLELMKYAGIDQSRIFAFKDLVWNLEEGFDEFINML
jgi:hypothetical protein